MAKPGSCLQEGDTVWDTDQGAQCPVTPGGSGGWQRTPLSGDFRTERRQRRKQRPEEEEEAWRRSKYKDLNKKGPGASGG